MGKGFPEDEWRALIRDEFEGYDLSGAFDLEGPIPPPKPFRLPENLDNQEEKQYRRVGKNGRRCSRYRY